MAILTNCVSTRINPLTKEDASLLKGKTLAIVHEEKPSFSAMTYKNMMISVLTGGIVGSILIIHEGNKIIKENQVEDPANLISANLSKNLESKYGLKAFDTEVSKDVGSVSELSSQYEGKADYVLDVKTINWSFGYLPMRPDSFRVIYGSKLQFIDVKKKKLIAEGFCSVIPDSKDSIDLPPSYQELLRNNAEILKQILISHSSKCSDTFRNKVFNL